MRTDDLLCELMTEIDAKEAEALDRALKEFQRMAKQQKTAKSRLRNQEKLIADKIHRQLQSESDQSSSWKDSSFRILGRRLIPLMTVFVMLMGMAALAKERDWDIRMAEMLGLSNVMEKLEGGYVEIGVSDVSEGITVTAVRLIGDQNSQWIQFDTDIPWEVGENGYYLFGDLQEYYRDKRGRIISGGGEFYSFDNQGYVSFISYRMDTEKINRAEVEIFAENIYAYQDDKEKQGTLIGNGKWQLSWRNCYAANTVRKHPYKWVTMKGKNGTKFTCNIHKIEISPISIRIEAWKNPLAGNTEDCFLEVDSVTLKDGTVIPCQTSSGGNYNNWSLESFISFQEIGQIDTGNVDYITIGGKRIQISSER
ncbi:MAG: hypothetical protein K2K56_03570 [Lachnospiraceae bacterium]|nr:hypothetical protein [Lachnospiraceae bacterium]